MDTGFKVGLAGAAALALLVTRMLGLRNIDDLMPVAEPPDGEPWAGGAYTDNEGRSWRLLDVRRLLSDERFLEIGV